MEIRNTKTGTIANLVGTYNRRSDNQKMYIVNTPTKTHWAAKNCEVA